MNLIPVLATGLFAGGVSCAAVQGGLLTGLISRQRAGTATTANGRQTVEITARTGSFSPANIQVRSGVPTTLVVKSDNAQGCVRSFVIRGEQKILPVHGETRIDLGVLQSGRLGYACGMGMYTGLITIV